jgi:cell wall-associated NlpC family hydrolase
VAESWLQAALALFRPDAGGPAPAPPPSPGLPFPGLDPSVARSLAGPAAPSGDFGLTLGGGSAARSGLPFPETNISSRWGTLGPATGSLPFADAPIQTQRAKPLPPAPPPSSGVGPIPAPGGAPNDARLAAHWPAIQTTAQQAGVDPRILGAAILQESGGDPTVTNPRTWAAGLLQALPENSPAGRGRGAGYTAEQLRDPALNLRLAVPDFQQAVQSVETEGRQYGWNVDDPVERAVYIIARAQRYGADASGSGRVAYTQPAAPAHEPFRRYVQQLFATQQVAAGGTPNPNAQAFLAAAEQYKDLPYVWGGSNRSGVDCSGLVIAAARDAGRPLQGRPSAQGIYEQVAKVDPSQVQPGDLVFFQGTDSGAPGETISHVGIVTRQGVMLNAPRPGTAVSYMNYDTPWWQSHIVGFGRMP